MVSRLITRTVLVSIMTALTWTLWWTWTAEFSNIYGNHTAQRVALTVLESSVLLAALSLLFESFLSFGTISIKRGGWAYVLSGICLLEKNREASSINTRTYELFGIRSVTLSILSMMSAICLGIIYQVGKAVVSFFLNPHMPAVDWNEILWFVGLIAIAIPTMLLLLAGQTFIEKKVANRVARVLVSVFYWSATFGLAIGTTSIFEPSGFRDMPNYLVMLMGTGVALAVVSFVGTVFGLGYAIYKLVGMASQRFPVLGNVWNQLCPVRTINFIK